MPKTILVVDDSYSVREAVGYTLKNEGFLVFSAEDGQDALKYLDSRKIDLVITDLHMPNLNGIELTRKVRKIDHYARVPIIILTTESQFVKKQEAKEAGATGWIVKPFVPEKLMTVIKRVIR
nr:response regulator [Bacteroidota bacterium]